MMFQEEARRRASSIVEVPPEEWRAILVARPNVLIEGPSATTDAILHQLWPHCSDPVLCWGDGLLRETTATLIVREVAALSATDQERLLRWSGVPGRRRQIISTTSQPLFPRVQRGLFLENLYYRLNVMRLEVEAFDVR
jgi:hypothetical protein